MNEFLRARFRHISAATAGGVVLLIYFYLGLVGWNYGQMSDLLLSEQWRNPTRIFTKSDRNEPFLEVWGPDWRQTRPVLIDDIPDHVQKAFIAAEDVRFESHLGIDPIGMARALVVNIRARGVRQGGSTITQQLVKTKLFSNDRTFARKLVEAPLAVHLDRRLSKQSILEAYLNEVYLGHAGGVSIQGIDEAAPIYFSKRVDQLSIAEAALLAAIVRAPNRDNPDKNPELAKSRRDRVLETMNAQGFIDDAELEKARTEPARFRRGSRPASDQYHWYTRALRAEVERLVGEDALERGGLGIVASIDPSAQRSAEIAVREGAQRLRNQYSWIRKRDDGSPLQMALLSVDPFDGGVTALVGGIGGEFDRTRMMRRQPGSAFKPFVYYAALASRRISPATLIEDLPLEIDMGGGEVWVPNNYDEKFHGRVTVRTAFEHSLNIPAVRIAEETGRSEVIRTAGRFGLESDFSDVPALALGVEEVSPWELTAAYTTFPNLGTRVEPYFAARIEDRNGDVLYEHESKPIKVTDPAPAYVMHSLLRGVVERGTARRLQRYGLGYVAGKTGTTSDYRDAWFVGYTPEMVTTLWVGFDDGSPLRLSSTEAALPVWGRYMNDFEPARRTIEPPDGVTILRIDPETGYIWQSGCPGPMEEVFLPDTEPAKRCPRGLLGRYTRDLMLDPDLANEPAAITLDKFRRLSDEVEQGRRSFRRKLSRLKEKIDDLFD